MLHAIPFQAQYRHNNNRELIEFSNPLPTGGQVSQTSRPPGELWRDLHAAHTAKFVGEGQDPTQARRLAVLAIEKSNPGLRQGMIAAENNAMPASKPATATAPESSGPRISAHDRYATLFRQMVAEYRSRGRTVDDATSLATQDIDRQYPGLRQEMIAEQNQSRRQPTSRKHWRRR